MYTLTGLEQGQTGGDCSGWEKDPESFSKRVADHYVRTVLKMGITVKRIILTTRRARTSWTWTSPMS